MSVAYDLGFVGLTAEPASQPCPRPRAVPLRRGGADVIRLLPPGDSAAWRLTRRGIVALWAGVAVLGSLLVLAAAASAPAAPGAPSVPAGARVTVAAGDSLWSIATRIAPGIDPRAEVSALERVNHLSGAVVRPGDVLRVP